MTIISIITRSSKSEVLLNTDLISSIFHVNYDENHDYAKITMNNGDVWETAQTFKEVIEQVNTSIFNPKTQQTSKEWLDELRNK